MQPLVQQIVGQINRDLIDTASSSHSAVDRHSDKSHEGLNHRLQWSTLFAEALLKAQGEDAPVSSFSTRHPLSCQPHHHTQLKQIQAGLQEGDMGLRFAQCLFPEPLSVYNDPNRIDNSVLYNAGPSQLPLVEAQSPQSHHNALAQINYLIATSDKIQ